MDYIHTELIEKNRVWKLYKVNLSQLGGPILRSFYAGTNSDILQNHHLAYKFSVADVYFKVFPATKHLTIKYTFKEIYEDDAVRVDDLDSSFDYRQHWSQKFFDSSEFDICWSEVARLIYADLEHCERKSNYRANCIADYENRFDKILIEKLTAEHNAVDVINYSMDLDMVTTISLVPMSVPKYLNYYKEQLANGKADYTATQLEVYEKFLLQEFSYAAAIMQDNNKFDLVSDFKPALTIQSFEFFVYQMKCVHTHAEDFNASKELIQKFDKSIVDLTKTQYGADVFDLKQDK
jgi:hypothetical protein